MKKIKHEEKFILCECSGHALSVMKFDDEDQYYISIWERPGGSNGGFFQKMKHIWKIIRTGSPYGDQVVLSEQKFKKLQQLYK